jgi:hypothetical protein
MRRLNRVEGGNGRKMPVGAVIRLLTILLSDVMRIRSAGFGSAQGCARNDAIKLQSRIHTAIFTKWGIYLVAQAVRARFIEAQQRVGDGGKSLGDWRYGRA